MSKILLIGGGGHCRSVLDTLLETGSYSEIGIIDKMDQVGQQVMGVPVIGCDDDLPALYRGGFRHAFVTLGSTGESRMRIKLFDLLETIGFDIPNIVDRTAAVSRYARLDTGIFVGKRAVVNAGTSVGKGAIVNTSAVIEHDCTVEAFCHIAPGSILCGQVHVGAESHVGAGSTVKQQIRIGSKAIVGMGSVVLHNVGDHVVAYGNPCREVRAR